ncbi:DUF418 domain-containing protein [Alteraurantiacibacter buctensis]|uniref:DUF418 domain-containing protein n=1 Tax=Alteraurantiacibacter buctensis TaxID=1503981 RepID=UPI0013705A97
MNGRISMVDALRGWALLGLFLVHCVERFALYRLEPWNDDTLRLIFALFGSKSFALFAMLFGFSFATIMGNARARGTDFTGRFIWRLVLLLGFGTLHVALFRGEILQLLAVVGLLMIPFDRVKSDRVLLAVAMVAFLQVPLLARMVGAALGQGWAAMPLFPAPPDDLTTLTTGTFWQATWENLTRGNVVKWSFYIERGRAMQIVGLFLVGMVIQRRGWLARADRHRLGWGLVLLGGGALGLLGRDLALLVADLLPGLPGDRHAANAGMMWSMLGWTAVHAAVFVFAWQTPVQRLLGWLAAPGRMTLTLYIGQSVLMAPLLYGWGLGLWDAFNPTVMALAGLVLFALQALAARWWFARFRYGPMEWLWRAGTLGTWAVPNRLAAANAR